MDEFIQDAISLRITPFMLDNYAHEYEELVRARDAPSRMQLHSMPPEIDTAWSRAPASPAGAALAQLWSIADFPPSEKARRGPHKREDVKASKGTLSAARALDEHRKEPVRRNAEHSLGPFARAWSLTAFRQKRNPGVAFRLGVQAQGPHLSGWDSNST